MSEKKKKTEEKTEEKAEEKAENNKPIRFKAQDAATLGVVLVYLVQARGQASEEEINAGLVDLNAKVDTRTVHNTLEALRKKRVLVEAHRGQSQGGERVYAMAQLRFNNTIEVAHVTNITGLIHKLKQVDLGTFEAVHNRLQETKEKRNPPPEDFARLRLRFRLMECWYGGMPYAGTDRDRDLYHRSQSARQKPPDEKEPFLVFERDRSGALIINRACILGWIKNHLPRVGKPDYMIRHFGCKPIRFTPTNGELQVTKKPVQRDGAQFSREGSGCGFSWYEILEAGTELELHFIAPLTNFLNLEELKAFMADALEMPHRSMSPARGRQWGSAELISLERM